MKTRAKFRWMPEKENSRPSSSEYLTAARFDRDPHQYWSLRVLFQNQEMLPEGFSLVDVELLVKDQSEKLLVTGTKFELFEGKKTAEGWIL